MSSLVPSGSGGGAPERAVASADLLTATEGPKPIMAATNIAPTRAPRSSLGGTTPAAVAEYEAVMAHSSDAPKPCMSCIIPEGMPQPDRSHNGGNRNATKAATVTAAIASLRLSIRTDIRALLGMITRTLAIIVPTCG